MKFYSPAKTAYINVTKNTFTISSEPVDCLSVQLVNGMGTESFTVSLSLSEAYLLKEYLDKLIEKVDTPQYKLRK